MPEPLVEKLTKYDFSVVFLGLIIAVIGLINIYSATGTSTVEIGRASCRERV